MASYTALGGRLKVGDIGQYNGPSIVNLALQHGPTWTQEVLDTVAASPSQSPLLWQDAAIAIIVDRSTLTATWQISSARNA